MLYKNPRIFGYAEELNSLLEIEKHNVENFTCADSYVNLVSASKEIDVSDYFAGIPVGGSKSIVLSEILGIAWVGDDFKLIYDNTQNGLLFHVEICRNGSVRSVDFNISDNPVTLFQEEITADNLNVCTKIVFT